jgi:hypothetical protein
MVIIHLNSVVMDLLNATMGEIYLGMVKYHFMNINQHQMKVKQVQKRKIEYFNFLVLSS